MNVDIIEEIKQKWAEFLVQASRVVFKRWETSFTSLLLIQFERSEQARKCHRLPQSILSARFLASCKNKAESHRCKQSTKFEINCTVDKGSSLLSLDIIEKEEGRRPCRASEPHVQIYLKREFLLEDFSFQKHTWYHWREEIKQNRAESLVHDCRFFFRRWKENFTSLLLIEFQWSEWAHNFHRLYERDLTTRFLDSCRKGEASH